MIQLSENLKDKFIGMNDKGNAVYKQAVQTTVEGLVFSEVLEIEVPKDLETAANSSEYATYYQALVRMLLLDSGNAWRTAQKTGMSQEEKAIKALLKLDKATALKAFGLTDEQIQAILG